MKKNLVFGFLCESAFSFQRSLLAFCYFIYEINLIKILFQKERKKIALSKFNARVYKFTVQKKEGILKCQNI